MEISLSKCLLRPWQSGDEDSLVRYANNRNIWINLRDLFPHPYTRQDAGFWVRYAQISQIEKNFAVVVGSEAVGSISLKPQSDIYHRSAEIGFWLGEEHWGKGIMTEAVLSVCEFGFSTLDLIRIYAHVLEWNSASMRVLEKCGFTQEGRMRKAAVKDGRVSDVFVYAQVRE